MSRNAPPGPSQAALPDGYLPYGAFSRAWERGVFLGFGVVMPLVWPSAIHLASCGAPPHSRGAVAAWIAYLAVQAANKAPVSFAYTTRGWRAALDALVSAAVFFGTLLFVLGRHTWLPPRAFQGVALLAGVSLVMCVATRMELGGEPIPLRREILCKGLTLLVSAPMLLVIGVAAFGPLGSLR